jgi:hypothetical protein
LAFSYWIDIPWFLTEGKLAAIFIKPSLGVSNWPVIYFINYTPSSSLALFITAPSMASIEMAPGALPRPGRVPEQRLLSPESRPWRLRSCETSSGKLPNDLGFGIQKA